MVCAGADDACGAGRGIAEAVPLAPAPFTAAARVPIPPAAGPPELAIEVPLPSFVGRVPAPPLAPKPGREASDPVGAEPGCAVSGVPIQSDAASAGSWMPSQRGSRTMALCGEEMGETLSSE